MINLYEKLGVSVNASPEQIQAAIKRAAENQTIALENLQRCRNVLLNPERRKQYNARLFAEHPEILEQMMAAAAPPVTPEPQPVYQQPVYQQPEYQAPPRSNKINMQNRHPGNQQPQVVVKNTGCFGIAGGIVLAIIILAVLPFLLLGFCTLGAVGVAAPSYQEYKEKAKQKAAEEQQQANSPDGLRSAYISAGSGTATDPYVATSQDIGRAFTQSAASASSLLSGKFTGIVGPVYATMGNAQSVILQTQSDKILINAQLTNHPQEFVGIRDGQVISLTGCQYEGFASDMVRFTGCTIRK